MKNQVGGTWSWAMTKKVQLSALFQYFKKLRLSFQFDWSPHRSKKVTIFWGLGIDSDKDWFHLSIRRLGDVVHISEGSQSEWLETKGTTKVTLYSQYIQRCVINLRSYLFLFLSGELMLGKCLKQSNESLMILHSFP